MKSRPASPSQANAETRRSAPGVPVGDLLTLQSKSRFWLAKAGFAAAVSSLLTRRSRGAIRSTGPSVIPGSSSWRSGQVRRQSLATRGTGHAGIPSAANVILLYDSSSREGSGSFLRPGSNTHYTDPNTHLWE